MDLVSDAGNHRQPHPRGDCDAIRSWRGMKRDSGLQRESIDHRQVRGPTIGDKNMAAVRNYARRFGKASQRGNVTTSVAIYHLDTIPSQVRHKNTAGFRIECAMVE